jgi:hypothetical protein
MIAENSFSFYSCFFITLYNYSGTKDNSGFCFFNGNSIVPFGNFSTSNNTNDKVKNSSKNLQVGVNFLCTESDSEKNNELDEFMQSDSSSEIMKENNNEESSSPLEPSKQIYLPLVSVDVHPLSYYSLPSLSGSSSSLYSNLLQKFQKIPFIFLTASSSGVVTIYSTISSSITPVIQLLVDCSSHCFLTSCSWCPCNPSVYNLIYCY